MNTYIKLTNTQLNSLDQLRDSLSNKIYTEGFARATTEQDTLDALEALVELYHERNQDTVYEQEVEIEELKEKIEGIKVEREDWKGDAKALANYVRRVQQELTPEQYEKLQPLQPCLIDIDLERAAGW